MLAVMELEVVGKKREKNRVDSFPHTQPNFTGGHTFLQDPTKINHSSTNMTCFLLYAQVGITYSSLTADIPIITELRISEGWMLDVEGFKDR